jgi:hypothetical protein
MQEANQLLLESKDNVNTFSAKLKRWDIRADRKVFWQYCHSSKTKEIWVTLDSAIRRNESIKKAAKKQRIKNPEKHSLANKQWRERNQEQHCKNARNYYQKNKSHANETKRKKRMEKRHSDPFYSLTQAVRSLISRAFKNKNYTKTSKTCAILGCSWDELARHIESQFTNGMNWGNRGQWHIDHIIPLASAQTPDDLLRLNHYTNLQPLWALDNLRKGAKVSISS